MADQNPEPEVENDEDETVIVGNLRRTNTVQTAYPLLAVIQRAKYSMSEYKILATYMSRINSQNPNSTVVSFPLSEYQELAGLPNLKPSDMKKYIAGLNKDIEVPPECAAQLDPGFTKSQEGFGYINLFGARFVSRKESGKWVVEIKCSDDAKKLFFFDLEQTRYVACLLDYLIDLTHMTTCYLYFRLKQMVYRGTFDIPLDVLRDDWLCLSESETYKNFKYFKRDVLEVAVAEINEKTDLLVDYEPVKKKRSVVAIRFKVKDNPNRKQKKLSSGKSTASDGTASVSTRDLYEQIELPYVDPDTPTAVMITEISGNAFMKEEVARIEEALCRKLPDGTNAAEARRQDLFRDSYAEMMVREQTGTAVKNRCSYLIGIINKNKNSMRSPKGDGAFSEEFVRYWEEYPGRTDDPYWGNKSAAYKRFTEFLHDHPNIDPEKIYEAESIYATECKLNHVPVGKITKPENFLISTSSHPDGKVFEYLDRVMAREKEEAERRAEESSPEHQAEKKRLDEYLQTRIHLYQPTAETAEPTDSDSTVEEKTEELMNFWKERRSEKTAWTEDSENRLRADISKNIREYGADRVQKALLRETETEEASELLPRMNLIGTVY